MTLINPTEAAFLFLIIVWIIGGVNQLYGVGLAIYKAARRKDYASILYDCVGWLLFLPALSALLFIGTKWGPGFRIGYLAALVVGLVLLLLGAPTGKGASETAHGSRQPLWNPELLRRRIIPGRCPVVLQAPRTGIDDCHLGVCLQHDCWTHSGPCRGGRRQSHRQGRAWRCGVFFGHLLNYFMGAMGAFIHSARLILLEFFGRFYEGGAPRFHRFGFSSEVVKVVENSGIQGKQEERHGS